MSRSTKGGIVYYESLRTMVRAGVPLGRALGIVADKTGGAFGGTVRDLEHVVQGGSPLHEAMARNSAHFPTLECALVRAGESGGRLEEVLGEILKVLYRTRDARNRVIQAAVYPIILVHVAILVPPVVTWFLSGFGAYLATVVPALGFLYGGVAAVWCLNRLAATQATFGTAWDAAKLRIPWIGGIFERAALARFARCLGAMNRSGIPVLSALDLSLAAIGNMRIRGRLAEAVRGVENGNTLSESILASGAFPMEMNALIETGEKTGSIDDCLDHVANALDDEVGHSLAVMGKVLPVLFLVIAMGFAILQLLNSFSATFGGMEGLPR